MDSTIFTMFSPLLLKLGITEQWLNATAVNVMTFVGMIKPKFSQIDGFWETSGVVAVSAAALAGVQFYGTPWAIPVAVVAIWVGTTLLMKGGEKTIDVSGFNRGPSKSGDK